MMDATFDTNSFSEQLGIYDFLSWLPLFVVSVVNPACNVEDEFDIEIPDRVIKNVKTVGDVIEFIEKQ